MSESDGEQAARSLALEQAYVHEVYEQCAERTVHGRHWPRIHQFLEDLEPGALVCDIGCGNGKYLNVNHNVFKIGVDRCKRFTNIAGEKGNEVLTCDNLSLPFRDESFDAVLSIAVVHHFSTTERRVRALKELARVLRIGGRLIISVWAMEQKHRKFESQDVLVPWPKAYCVSSSGSPMRARGMSYDERHHRGKSAQTYLLSKRAGQRKGSKSYWIDPIFSPSPSTSSLSSPNETCYSFFRRALQKLAGGRRSSRAWFLENWQNGGKERNGYGAEGEDDGDVDDLPIELRRVEETAAPVLEAGARRPHHHSDSLSVKSKSLGSIVEVQRVDLVRSRSSIPGLSAPASATSSSELEPPEPAADNPNATTCAPESGCSKPRLVKQTHFLEENLGPDLLLESAAVRRVLGVHKQSSMNEELMSIERLKERESVRRNIMKQASLNEELIYKSRPALEAFKDSLYSGSATKRFQLLKSGLTNRIRQSTTNIEKVSGMAIKNGFVRILQSWKSTESPPTPTTTTPTTSATGATAPGAFNLAGKGLADGIERRPSREDGSDSSKDSSLQSDTSVDSEDSFASVIYVPKKSASPLLEALGAGPAPGAYQLSTTSAPPSPRVKYAPELASGPAGHRLKLVGVSPLLKQFPATSKSLPPPSPPGLSPRTLNSANMRPFFASSEAAHHLQQQQQLPPSGTSLLERIAEVKRSFDVQQPLPKIPAAKSPVTIKVPSPPQSAIEELANPPTQLTRGYRAMSEGGEAEVEPAPGEASPLLADAVDEALERLSEKSLSSSDSTGTTTTTTASEEDESRCSRLNQIKELLRGKPGFASRSKPSFPLVRRASTATSGRLEQVGKALPRLLSLELFNPETDDLDSDSSGVSSPESAGSVISVISDERYLSRKEAEAAAAAATAAAKEADADAEIKLEELPRDEEPAEAGNPVGQGLRLFEAAAGVASSLGEAVGTFVQPAAKPTTAPLVLDKHISPVESTWSEECKRHLIDLTDRLSGSLVGEVGGVVEEAPMRRSCSEESEADSFVVVTRAGEFASERELRRLGSGSSESVGSSGASSSLAAGRRLCTGSTASLASSSRVKLCAQTRSASEETPPRLQPRAASLAQARRPPTSASNGTLSGSSSQESLPSDQITYHQYYHVFREGELDQLIDKYVENLHIISSYYDHASWCIVAEKVQVWTI